LTEDKKNVNSHKNLKINNMLEKIKLYRQELANIKINSLEELESFRIKYLGKKGIINQLFEEFKIIPKEEKKEVGQQLNELKNRINDIITAETDKYKKKENKDKKHDLTLQATQYKVGSRHPISIVRNEILEIFKYLGFTISEGPEIEDDWHVFTALNFPEEHPARDMQDTFFITKDQNDLLRTHTSSVQVRVMETQKPPIRVVSPGRVYRNEAISARSHCMFHQVEGLYIDKNVSFADLKQTLMYFAKEMFGNDIQIKLRPSFFPFTEPSAEMDISCTICKGKGCPICKYTGWLEILGCGMVDPNVLKNCGINPEIYSGFAFGMGIERMALLKYRITDIRIYFENDVRFLNQFIKI
jgi:phenylalanyl-tRNA synthetase alpha chain